MLLSATRSDSPGGWGSCWAECQVSAPGGWGLASTPTPPPALTLPQSGAPGGAGRWSLAALGVGARPGPDPSPGRWAWGLRGGEAEPPTPAPGQTRAQLCLHLAELGVPPEDGGSPGSCQDRPHPTPRIRASPGGREGPTGSPRPSLPSAGPGRLRGRVTVCPAQSRGRNTPTPASSCTRPRSTTSR